MSKNAHQDTHRAGRPEPRQHPLTEPVDVVDGIADRSSRPVWWKYAALLCVFLAWVAVLVYIRIAGSQ